MIEGIALRDIAHAHAAADRVVVRADGVPEPTQCAARTVQSVASFTAVRAKAAPASTEMVKLSMTTQRWHGYRREVHHEMA